MKTAFSALALSIAIAAAGNAPAQVAAPNQEAVPKQEATPNEQVKVSPISKFILDMFKAHENNILCSIGNVPVTAFEEQVLKHLNARAGETVTQDAVEKAVLTLFPCPFSPLRPELVAATAKNIAGVWLFPYDSQPYRYGSKSPLQPTSPDQAISCEVIGYYAGGELRTGTSMGAKTPCPFRKAADVDPARKRPRVANWKMTSNGHLKVTRSDIKDYAEEWDIYLVTKAFQVLNMEIKARDLVAFRRSEKDSDRNASTEFRHLQRLK